MARQDNYIPGFTKEELAKKALYSRLYMESLNNYDCNVIYPSIKPTEFHPLMSTTVPTVANKVLFYVDSACLEEHGLNSSMYKNKCFTLQPSNEAYNDLIKKLHHMQ